MEVKPCPCCGSDDVFVGPHAAMVECVECQCGLRMLVPWSDDNIPEAEGLEGNEYFKVIRTHYIKIAIERWNTRI